MSISPKDAPVRIDQRGLPLRPVMKATVVDMNVMRREEKILPVLEAAATEKIPVLCATRRPACS